MPKSFANRTRKHCKSKRKICLDRRHIDAKKATKIKCRMKTCRANKYKSVYGSSGGNIRSNVALF